MSTLSKNVIEKLYHKEKLSAAEVAKKLNTTVWSVLGFMVRNEIPRRTFREANEIFFQNQPLTFFIKKNLTLKERELKIAGIFLYWAEGGKPSKIHRNWTVDLANSDPKMISLFLKFLREICRINEGKLSVQLYCYANQDVEELKRYWAKVTKIPKEKFIKPYVRQDFKPYGRKMQYGLVHIRYCDKKLLFQIDDWIKEYCKKFKIMIK